MIEDALAAWAAELRWEDVPAPVQARTEDLLLDAIASGLGGRSQELVARVGPVATAFAGEGSPAQVTFLDAYAITAATLCDVYRPGLCHVTPVVVPPLAALTELHDPAGHDFLAAFVVGLEVTVRLCRALHYPSVRARGWHSPGVVGPVGAAAAGARLLGLDTASVSSAMAHGAAQSAGTFASLGTAAVKFNQARGAIAGLLAAQMAEAGLAASPLWFTDADGGMAHCYSDGGRPEELVRGLGETWELQGISLRRWPAASSVQSLIDLCLAAHVRAQDIVQVRIALSPGAYQVSGDRGWHDSLAAQQSARWVAATVLRDDDWWLGQSAPERLCDPVLGAFAAERVVVTSASDLAQAGVRLEIDLRDRRTLTAGSDTAPGDPDRPLTREQVEDKLRRVAAETGMAIVAEEMIDHVRNQRSGEAVASLVALLRPERSPR